MFRLRQKYLRSLGTGMYTYLIEFAEYHLHITKTKKLLI